MLNDKEYQLPLFNINDQKRIAVFDMLSSCEMASDAVFALLYKIKAANLGKIDVVLSAETKGIILADRLANLLDAKMVILRKENKMYFENVIQGSVRTYTSKGENHLYLNGDQAKMIKDKNVLIVDDVVSTGSSLITMEDILAQAGGNVVGKAFVFAEGDSYKRDDIIYVDKLPIFEE